MPSTDWVGSPGMTEKAVKASTLTSRRVAASRASRLSKAFPVAASGASRLSKAFPMGEVLLSLQKPSPMGGKVPRRGG